ncbi:MAG TPA: acetoin utilization protein AcuC [Thermoplasmata archaeon]|nr:acetoin utilization protein AcuC [Thermoplasmata archaeon]
MARPGAASHRVCPVTVLWDERFLHYDFGPGHPFSETSRAAAVDLLEELRYFDGDRRTQERAFEPATAEELGRFHTPTYLHRVERISGSARRALLDAGDTPSFPGCYDAAARLAGGTLRGLRIVDEQPDRHAFQPGGGLHHAHPGNASGFCIFNDVAVALATFLAPGTARRAAYIDIDVHHGDGVMYGFYGDGRLLDIDFHQDGRTLFPGTGAIAETGTGDGQGLKVNVPFAPGTGSAGFLEAFRSIVPAMIRAHRPELIVVQAGVDGHEGDRLGQLAYGREAYFEAIRIVHDLAHEVAGGRLLVTGGGGYRPENVSRVLAQDALVLGGASADVPPGGPLPLGWSERFRQRTGEPPPADWGPSVPRDAREGELEAIGSILRELEANLGRPLRGE